jgi:tripeptide aminopeptidase
VLRADRDRLLATFLELVRIDSPSLQEGAAAAWAEERLRRLGWSVGNDRTGPEAGNVVARLDGGSGEPLLLSSHLDVVQPCLGTRPRVRDGWVETDGRTVLGADAKAGVAALLEAATAMHARGQAPPCPLELVLTWGEEVGHQGARALDASALRARRGIVLDALRPVGDVVVGAPGYTAVSVQVRGRAAHAGVEPERGISAIAVAADAIQRLPLGRLDELTTANIGTISGGSVRNAVPEVVRLEGEVRSLEPARLEAVGRQVEEAFRDAARRAGAAVDVELRRMYEGYRLADDAPSVDLARRAFAALGGRSRLVVSGGGSDANELNRVGLEACVVGIGAQDCHSVRERIEVAELERLASWVLAMIDRAGTGGAAPSRAGHR